MASCEDCIHENVCLHRANVQTDTYAYMGVKYDTEKCEHYMPADAAPEVEELIYKLECLLCHATGGKLSKHTYDLRTMESVVTDYVNDTYWDAYAEAKKEVSREIFAEIDSMIFGTIIPDDCAIISIARLAELKKKYTEDQT